MSAAALPGRVVVIARREECDEPSRWQGRLDLRCGDRAADGRSRRQDAARRLALSGHLIGRLGMPDDIAKGIVFLASDDAAFMTGAGLVVDGGLTAQ